MRSPGVEGRSLQPRPGDPHLILLHHLLVQLLHHLTLVVDLIILKGELSLGYFKALRTQVQVQVQR